MKDERKKRSAACESRKMKPEGHQKEIFEYSIMHHDSSNLPKLQLCQPPYDNAFLALLVLIMLQAHRKLARWNHPQQ